MASPKVEKVKPYNNGQWTEARMHSFIKGALRSASQRWPPKYETLNAACIGVQLNERTNRFAKHYLCAECGNAFPSKDVEVNHRIPVIPVTGFDSWDGVVARMYCEKEHLEVLCKPCHKKITKEENTQRKLNV